MSGKMFESGTHVFPFPSFFQNGGMYHENEQEIRYAVHSGASGAGFCDFFSGGGYLPLIAHARMMV